MNFRDLNYFVKTAELNHFGKAANACFVSQPTLSMQLKKLEDTLGVKLFERDNKHVKLTRQGGVLLTQAKTILLEADHLKKLALNFNDPFALEFHLGVFPTIAPYLLPTITPHIKAMLPKLSLFYSEEKTDTLVAALEEGSLDAIIVALPIKSDKLITTPLFTDPFMVALPKNHPLTYKKQIEMHDLDVSELLLLEEGHCLRGQALDICHQRPKEAENSFTATSLSTLTQMVSLGHGITLVPTIAIKAVQSSSIVFRPFRAPTPARQIVLAYRRHHSSIACCKKVAELIIQSFSSDENENKVMKGRVQMR